LKHKNYCIFTEHLPSYSTDAEFNVSTLSSLFIPVTLVVMMVVMGELCRYRYQSVAEHDFLPADEFVRLNEAQVKMNTATQTKFFQQLKD